MTDFILGLLVGTAVAAGAYKLGFWWRYGPKRER